jgi:hypothetical protein
MSCAVMHSHVLSASACLQLPFRFVQVSSCLFAFLALAACLPLRRMTGVNCDTSSGTVQVGRTKRVMQLAGSERARTEAGCACRCSKVWKDTEGILLTDGRWMSVAKCVCNN